MREFQSKKRAHFASKNDEGSESILLDQFAKSIHETRQKNSKSEKLSPFVKQITKHVFDDSFIGDNVNRLSQARVQS